MTNDELLTSSAENLRFALKCLETAEGFDTSPAVATGSKRAAAGVPLPAVMDAYRIASHHLWDAVVQIATTQPGVSRDVLIQATTRIWHIQDAYTDAMTSAYRQQTTQQVLEDEAERAALTEALVDGRTLTDYTVWEVAQLLRLPISGPYVVVAASLSNCGQAGASRNHRYVAQRRHLLRVAPPPRHSNRYCPRPNRIQTRYGC